MENIFKKYNQKELSKVEKVPEEILKRLPLRTEYSFKKCSIYFFDRNSIQEMQVEYSIKKGFIFRHKKSWKGRIIIGQLPDSSAIYIDLIKPDFPVFIEHHGSGTIDQLSGSIDRLDKIFSSFNEKESIGDMLNNIKKLEPGLDLSFWESFLNNNFADPVFFPI